MKIISGSADVHESRENTEQADEIGGNDHDAAAHAACLFHAFSDVSRTRIVQHLLYGEHNVKQLTEHVGLAQTTVSGHLACLLECGVVQRRAVGRASFYSLKHPQETVALLEAAEGLLTATGHAVALCSHHGSHVHPTEEGE